MITCVFANSCLCTNCLWPSQVGPGPYYKLWRLTDPVHINGNKNVIYTARSSRLLRAQRCPQSSLTACLPALVLPSWLTRIARLCPPPSGAGIVHLRDCGDATVSGALHLRRPVRVAVGVSLLPRGSGGQHDIRCGMACWKLREVGGELQQQQQRRQRRRRRRQQWQWQ